MITRSKLAEIDQVGTTRARQVMDVACSEKDFEAAVVEYARLHGWLVFHPWTSLHSEEGWPDLAMVRHGQMVAAECKRQHGKMTRAQQVWLDALATVPGITAVCWRPSNWDEIEEVLR